LSLLRLRGYCAAARLCCAAGKDHNVTALQQQAA
jgi:hypothetical protein